MLRKDGQQLDHRLVPVCSARPGGEIGLFELGLVHVDPPFLHQLKRALELGFGGSLAKHLAGLQEADQPVPQAHRHRCVAQARRTADRVWLVGRHFGKLFLHLQARGAGPARLRHNSAERTFIALAVMGKLPRFHRAQGHRQPRGFGEGPFVVLKDLRVAESLNQAAVAAGCGVAARFAGCSFRGCAICPRAPATPRGFFGWRRAGFLPAGRARLSKCCLHRTNLWETNLSVNYWPPHEAGWGAS